MEFKRGQLLRAKGGDLKENLQIMNSLLEGSTKVSSNQYTD